MYTSPDVTVKSPTKVETPATFKLPIPAFPATDNPAPMVTFLSTPSPPSS